jgi:hypothetical protein
MLCVAILTLGGTAHAVEVHTLIGARCQAVSGIVVSVTEDSVLLIDLGGHARVWSRDDISSVVLHRAVDNPLANIELDPTLQSHLYNVTLVDSDGIAFTGFPVGFIEELVVFYDLYGRTHVLALEDIDRMLHPSPIDGVSPPHAPITLHFPSDYIDCQELANQGGVPPSRIIGDKVKVGDYFDTFEQRYHDLESFRERTFLYAKPFLFDERTRLGLLYMRHRGPLIPVYIHWSSGRPYGFQSFLLLGGAPSPWLPTVQPWVVLWSDLKSHIFHATFMTNPFAIPAGTSTFFNGTIEPHTEADHHTESSFNYLILMGGDYGPWSASVGTHYPTRFFRILPLEREVTATRAGLVFRARATFDHLAFRALYYRTRQADDDRDGLYEQRDDDIVYSWREDVVRVGASAKLFDTEASLDAVVNRGTYRHYQLGATLSREFGHYVRMNVHANYYLEQNRVRGGEITPDGSTTRRQFDYGGAFEFQF